VGKEQVVGDKPNRFGKWELVEYFNSKRSSSQTTFGYFSQASAPPDPLYPSIRVKAYPKLNHYTPTNDTQGVHVAGDKPNRIEVPTTRGTAVMATTSGCERRSGDSLVPYPDDCILYKKDYVDSTNYPTCGISRWKEGKVSILKEGVPAKVRAAFSGKLEYDMPPKLLTREEVLQMAEGINYKWGSKNGESVGENDGDRVCWKKKSKFFDLEYWKYLPVRHVLDVMYIEKNVCDSIIGTLLEIPGKNKDEIAARLDLLNIGVKTDLQPEYGERRTCLPPGPWNFSRA
ncbi:unnamed protein product, partial [Prunus brigantina]